MGYLQDRDKRIEIFEETMRLCEANPILSDAVVNTRKCAKLYDATEAIFVGNNGNSDTKGDRKTNTNIYVTKRRSLEAAQELIRRYPEYRVGVLNFASATTPGGGVIRGSNAQEECLCRSSTLYPCLRTKEWMNRYYAMHRERRDNFYTDACIYTPGIVGIREDGQWPELLEEKDWYTFDVLSCAAPNMGRQPDIVTWDEEFREKMQQVFDRRVKRIIQVALVNQIDVLVLGAFGCGAFGNNPEVVAGAFKKALDEYGDSFRAIEFAVYCSKVDQNNYDIFSTVL